MESKNYSMKTTFLPFYNFIKAKVRRLNEESLRIAIQRFSFVMVCVVFVLTSYSQQNIGIGTTTPDSSALLDLNSNSKGLLLPRIALTGANTWSLSGSKPIDGMVIYNSAYAGSGINAVAPGIYYWRGNQWFAVFQTNGLNFTGADSADCANAGGGLTPQTIGFTNGQSYSGIIKARYYLGNGGTYPGEVVTVNGITLTRLPGTLNTGGGYLTYSVSGTYTGTSGNYVSFPLNLLGGSLCNVTLPRAPAIYTPNTLNCLPGAPATGTYRAGVPTNASNVKVISIGVSVTGSYLINSFAFANNGVTFSGSGMAIGGQQNSIDLTASGTPLATGTYFYTVNVGGQSCSFSVYYGTNLTVSCAGIYQNTPASTLVNGTTYSGTVTWNYSNGNGTYAIPSQVAGPINGLTLTRPSSTAATGNGSVTYTLSGTYTGPTGGIVTIPITLDGVSCNAVYGDNIRNALSAGGCADCAAYDVAFANTWIEVDSNEYNQLKLKLAGSFVAGAADISQPIYNVQSVGTGATFSNSNARVPASSYIAGFSVANAVDGNVYYYYRSYPRVKTSPFFTTGYVNYGGYLPNDSIYMNFNINDNLYHASKPISYYVNKTPGVITYAGLTYLGYYDGGGRSPFNDINNGSFNSTQGSGDASILMTPNNNAWFKIQAITTTTKQW